MLCILDRSIDFDHLLLNSTETVADSYDDIDSFSELIIEFVLGDEDLVSESDNDQGSPYNNHGSSATGSIHFAWTCPDLPFFGLPEYDHLIESTAIHLPFPWIAATSKGFRRISSPPPDFIAA